MAEKQSKTTTKDILLQLEKVTPYPINCSPFPGKSKKSYS